MAEILFAMPVLPGMEELDRQTMDQMAESRRDEYEAALREAGITRQAVWHQETPDGTLALVYIQADDPDAAQRLTGSDADISRWFVEKMKEVHGIDIPQPPPPVDKVHDYRSRRFRNRRSIACATMRGLCAERAPLSARCARLLAPQ